MKRKEMVALILAGGKGSRLGSLTSCMPKPTIHYGGDYRMIDFPISNCINSGITNIAVLTQYYSGILHSYIDNLNCCDKITGLHLKKLPASETFLPYQGTADAIYKNMNYINTYRPTYVLILSGDHIYKMNYAPMLEFHKKSHASITIASTPVKLADAHRYGLLYADSKGKVSRFEEKPIHPKTNLASMGIYIFTWKALKSYLLLDHVNTNSTHDFGNDLIPSMLHTNESVYTYKYTDYWRDVGTIRDLWRANMDLVGEEPTFQIENESWPIYSSIHNSCSYCPEAENVRTSVVAKNSQVNGKVSNSVISHSVIIHSDAQVTDSVILPNTYIGKDVKIHKSIIGSYSELLNGVKIGISSGIAHFQNKMLCEDEVSLVAPYTYLNGRTTFSHSSHIESSATLNSIAFSQHKGVIDTI